MEMGGIDCEDCLHYGQNGEPCPLTYCFHETAKHTPGPLRNDHGYLMNQQGQSVADCQANDDTRKPIGGAQRDRNAEFITQAFSTFDGLADTARGFIAFVFGDSGEGGTTPGTIQARGWALRFKSALEGGNQAKRG